MNDFEIKFRRALLDVLRSIQQSISTIDKKCNADSNQHEPPAPPDRPTQVQVPPAVADYYEAENRDRPDSTNRDRIRLCVEIVGLAAVIVGGTFAYRTFHEAQRQATAAQAQVDIMQKQLDATIRPWIRISEIRLDTSIPTAPVLSFMPYPAIKPTEGMFIRLVFVIKNVGAGVAQDVFIWPAIVLERQDAHEDALAKEQVRSCDYFSNVNMPPGPTHFSWSAVFPGDEIRQNTGTGIPYSDEFIIHLPGRSENYLAATVTGCVTYQSAKHYQTRAAYYVMGAHDRFIEIGKKLNPPSIRLLRDQHYEYAK